MASFEQTSVNTVHRKAQRGAYDHATVHGLIDSTPVLHVAFNPPPSSDPDEPSFPAVLPMLGCTGSYKSGADPDATPADDEERVLYLHGYVSARLMRLPEKAPQGQSEGVPVTVSATAMDGIILALTPFNHSCNYRSAVVFGFADIVEDESEKLYAMRRITNNLISQRWSETRLPTPAELKSTGILRVRIHTGSAKIHVGGPANDKKDLKDTSVMDKVWTGVVPTWTQYGPLMEGHDNKIATPEYLKEWVEKEREGRKKEAFEALKEDGEVGVKEAKEGRGYIGTALGWTASVMSYGAF